MDLSGIFGRRSVASENAPSVSLAVTTMRPLPAPPYEGMDSAAKRTKKPKLLPETPVRLKVGQEYDFITTGVIARIRVEKIWQDQESGDTFVVVSQRTSQGGRATHAIHISEFKQRVIAGGVPEVQI